MNRPEAMANAPQRPRRRRRGSGAITLADVARIAGVSPITASRALNTPETVAPETRVRVQDAVARTGYVPNRIAGGLASARSGLVAAVVPAIVGRGFLKTIEALTTSLEGAGYQLILGQSGYAQSREDSLLEAIISRRPDAIVLTGVIHSPDARKRLSASKIPVVETWDLTSTPIDMLVGFSHEHAGEAVAEYLVSTGRRKLGVISADDSRAARRVRAFSERARHLLGREHVQGSHIVPAPGTLGAGREALSHLISDDSSIDAVFCSSDLLALGALIEANARGVRVPEKLAIVGFGDLDFAADTEPSLTTVRIDSSAMGEQAARFIISRVRGEVVEPRIVDVGFELVPRGSS